MRIVSFNVPFLFDFFFQSPIPAPRGRRLDGIWNEGDGFAIWGGGRYLLVSIHAVRAARKLRARWGYQQ